MKAYFVCLSAILHREVLRFIAQKGRLGAALIRPLLWLFVFAAGFRAALGLSVTPPYQTYITYEEYIIPGLCGMILLFNGMQTALTLVYDREMGSMRILLTSPLPRWWLLFSKLLGGCIVSLGQIYIFLAIAEIFLIDIPIQGLITAFPAFLLVGLMLGSMGLLVSSLVKQLENFAGIMNFVIFPTYFLSTALYPLWRMEESSLFLSQLCAVNPFSHGVEFIRFALYGQFASDMLAYILLSLTIFWTLAIGPFTIYAIKKNPTLYTNEEKVNVIQ